MTGHRIGDSVRDMQLAEYLKAQELSDQEFAELIGTSRQVIHRYRTGKRFPRKKVRDQIFRVTGGLVTPADFLEVLDAEAA